MLQFFQMLFLANNQEAIDVWDKFDAFDWIPENTQNAFGVPKRTARVCGPKLESITRLIQDEGFVTRDPPWESP